jgi:hypothetical protein
MSTGHVEPSGTARQDLLKGLRVQISGAVPEEESWTQPNLNEQILAFVQRLSELVMLYGGHVVHGNHPAFTPAIVGRAQAVVEGRAAGAPSHPPDRSLVTLYASALWPLAWPFPLRPDVVSVVQTPKVGDGDVKDATTRNLSLTALRLAMVQDVDVVVTVGGKLHRDTGYNPGVLEELTVARWRGLPCFIIASYGGLAAGLDAEIIGAFSAGNKLDEAPMAEGDAGESLQRLASWDEDIPSAAGKVVAHFVTHVDEFKGLGRKPSDWPPGIAIRPNAALVGDAAVGVADVPRPLIDRSLARFQEVLQVVKASKPDLHRLRELLEEPPLP